MKIATPFLSALLLIGTLGVGGTAGAQDVLAKVELEPGSNYCHMKFPAMRERTVTGNNPVLKSATDSDIIDYSGPCDHDPRGKDEIQSQRDRNNHYPELW